MDSDQREFNAEKSRITETRFEAFSSQQNCGLFLPLKCLHSQCQQESENGYNPLPIKINGAQ